ncbi:hypothetical protein FGE12_29160 [Aggregicoccus sp. 17bor-14]|uniref:DUF1440 domain-containing protein n=1 Tax=Myxococcaceae TaxID=31 RepID=UPI00129C78C1|nr:MULTISPECIES: DUF1440 domain-containing protein [Myxococcaceae]MBF5046520.1 hypothetical protein [Simulacricoccus sp. 17bor-14]MRI92235.1 hypothetical protein [Aggregicoccus sp. 17bor-14]
MIRYRTGYPLRRREHDSLVADLLCGAAAGLLGALAMTPVMTRLAKPLSRALDEEQKGGGKQEPATEKTARKLLEPVGVRVRGERKKKLGNVVHFGYGTVWGAIYGALWGRTRLAGKLFGLGFGTALFVLGDELGVPALKLAPPPQETPASTHLSALGAHWVYGATTEAAFRGLSRLAARA